MCGSNPADEKSPASAGLFFKHELQSSATSPTRLQGAATRVSAAATVAGVRDVPAGLVHFRRACRAMRASVTIGAESRGGSKAGSCDVRDAPSRQLDLTVPRMRGLSAKQELLGLSEGQLRMFGGPASTVRDPFGRAAASASNASAAVDAPPVAAYPAATR